MIKIDMRKCIYLGIGFLLTCLIIIDFIFPENLLVQKYVPNLVIEIFGIFFVVALVDQLLRAERRRETERFQQHQRIKTAGLNIRSIPDDEEDLLRIEFKKLWEIGGLGDQEYREAAMEELQLISIFTFGDENKVTLLIKAIKNQFLELVGPDYIPFDDKWKEDLILRGIEILGWTCCQNLTIYSKKVFTKVQDTILHFFDVAIDYEKEKIALKCFKAIESLEKYIKENRDRSEMEDKEWREHMSFITEQIADMKESVYIKIKQKGYDWDLK